MNKKNKHISIEAILSSLLMMSTSRQQCHGDKKNTHTQIHNYL